MTEIKIILYIGFVLLTLLIFYLTDRYKKKRFADKMAQKITENLLGKKINLTVDYRVGGALNRICNIYKRLYENAVPEPLAKMKVVAVQLQNVQPSDEDDNPFQKKMTIQTAGDAPDILLSMLLEINDDDVPMTDMEKREFTHNYTRLQLLSDDTVIENESIRVLNDFRKDLKKALETAN